MLQYGDTSAPFQKFLPSIGLKEMFYDSINDLICQTRIRVGRALAHRRDQDSRVDCASCHRPLSVNMHSDLFVVGFPSFFLAQTILAQVVEWMDLTK